MKIVYRASAPASFSDLADRFGPTLNGLEERVAQALLNFERVWASRSGGRSRYSNGKFPVLYTAITEEVALVEKGHWVVKLLLDPLKMSIDLPFYYVYEVEIDGSCREYSVSDDVRIVHPTDYAYCNALGSAAVNDGISYLLVPSARRMGGTCAPVFCSSNTSLDNLSSKEFYYSWNHEASLLTAIFEPTIVDICFDNVFELSGGV